MKSVLLWVNRIIAALLALVSLDLVWVGGKEIVATSGSVMDSEFGMLITLVYQIGGLRLWLGLFALWLLTHPRLLVSMEEK